MKRVSRGSATSSRAAFSQKNGKTLRFHFFCISLRRLDDSLSVIIAKQLQELPYEKRSGDNIARAWINRLAFDQEKSTSEACALLNLLEFVPAMAELLAKEPETLIAKMNEARDYRESPGRIIAESCSIGPFDRSRVSLWRRDEFAEPGSDPGKVLFTLRSESSRP